MGTTAFVSMKWPNGLPLFGLVTMLISTHCINKLRDAKVAHTALWYRLYLPHYPLIPFIFAVLLNLEIVFLAPPGRYLGASTTEQ